MSTNAGWTLHVTRVRREKRAGELRARTVGHYRVLHDGVPAAGPLLSGDAVEREGPGDNGYVGKEERRCIEAGTYPLGLHDTDNYSTVDYETNGDHPRPAVLVRDTDRRTAILVHPAADYGSTIGCINLGSGLVDANSDLDLADSTRRVIAVIDDLKSFLNGRFPSGAFPSCRIVVDDPPLDQVGTQLLRRGSQGPLVQAWQVFLQRQGLLQSAPDGRYGRATEVATEAFQTAQRLAVDGRVGPQTIARARTLGFDYASPPMPAILARAALHAADDREAVAAAPLAPRALSFGFASEWKHLVGELINGRAPQQSESGLARRARQLLMNRYAGRPLMMGFDVGIFMPPGSDEDGPEKRREKVAFKKLIADLRAEGSLVAIYLEGAFGATGEDWNRQEAERFVAAAIAEGLTSTSAAPRLVDKDDENVKMTAPLAALLRKWDRQGSFWPYTLKLIRHLRDSEDLEIDAVEIDNLGRPFDEHASAAFDRPGFKGFLGFLRAYADEFARGSLPRLILKNIDAATLRRLHGLVIAGDAPDKLPRAMLADFHIFEVDEDLDDDAKADQCAEIERESARLGIQAVFSMDTHEYRCHGEFSDAAAVGLQALSSPRSGPEALELARAPMRLSAAVSIEAAAHRASFGLTADQRLVCERVINVYETGSITGDYANITIYPDGPHGMRQITYGRAQTTEYGNLAELVRMYVDAAGTYSERLRPFVPLVKHTELVDNEEFKQLLKRAGREDPVMARVQDDFFDKRYFKPAEKWAVENGFTRPLSMLVIYDSFIHSGSILPFLRARFEERPPAAGGREQEWIRQYVDARHAWLAGHSNSILRQTIYRTRDFKREIGRGNWSLAQLPVSANGTPVTAAAAVSRMAPAGVEAVPFLGGDGLEAMAAGEIWGDETYAAGAAEATAAAPTRAQLAERILASPSITLATGHISGVTDLANARQNIEDTAAGLDARRSSYGTAPGGTVVLDRRLLAALLDLAATYTFSVVELCGGSHNANSRHYAGVAVDVGKINGRTVGAGHPDVRAFMQRCRALGATEVLGPGNAHHDHHVHAAWPWP